MQYQNRRLLSAAVCGVLLATFVVGFQPVPASAASPICEGGPLSAACDSLAYLAPTLSTDVQTVIAVNPICPDCLAESVVQKIEGAVTEILGPSPCTTSTCVDGLVVQYIGSAEQIVNNCESEASSACAEVVYALTKVVGEAEQEISLAKNAALACVNSQNSVCNAVFTAAGGATATGVATIGALLVTGQACLANTDSTCQAAVASAEHGAGLVTTAVGSALALVQSCLDGSESTCASAVDLLGQLTPVALGVVAGLAGCTSSPTACAPSEEAGVTVALGDQAPTFSLIDFAYNSGGSAMFSSLDALGALGSHPPDDYYVCPEPYVDARDTHPAGEPAYVGVLLSASHSCNQAAAVYIKNFYIHSSSLGTGTQTTQCQSDSGDCEATLNWTSRYIACGESGQAAVPFSFDYGDPSGNYWHSDSLTVTYQHTCSSE